MHLMEKLKELAYSVSDKLCSYTVLDVYGVSDLKNPVLLFTLKNDHPIKNPKVVYEDSYIRIADFSYTLSSLKKGDIVKFVYKKIHKDKAEEVLLDGPMFKILDVSIHQDSTNILGVVEYEDREHRQLMHACYIQACESNVTNFELPTV